jgi:hypothetical protein
MIEKKAASKKEVKLSKKYLIIYYIGYGISKNRIFINKRHG